jgi:predicted NBD/HSP70 family sugar kinase
MQLLYVIGERYLQGLMMSTLLSEALVATSSSGNSAVLRQRNSATVLEVVKRADRALRVAEIAQVTGLSRPTVETVAEGLLGQGWLTVDDSSLSPRPGRPARRFAFNVAAGFVVGVDIGAHSVAAVIADLSGAAAASKRERVAAATPSDERLRLTETVVRDLLRQAQVPLDKVLALTVGTPGTITPDSGHVGKSPGMPGWATTDIIGRLSASFDCPIMLENDANLAAVGERASGVAAGSDDVLFLLLGERLGAGVIANGRLVRGRNGAAGELGYIGARGASDRPAEYGPLESQVNAEAIVALGRQEIETAPRSELARLAGETSAVLTVATISQAANLGDPAAIRVLARAAKILARGIAPALLTLNSNLLVIGGGISRAGEVLRQQVDDEISGLVLYPPQVMISALGDRAVLAGAVDQSLGVVDETILARVSA